MPLKMPAPSQGVNFDPAPMGTHIATCCRVIDLGTQTTEFQGQKSDKHQILLGWELPDELMDDGRPFLVTKRYTYSSHPKSTLRQQLEAWRGKKFAEDEIEEFDIFTLIGVPCMLSIVHEEKQKGQYLNLYAKVDSVMRLPKGTRAPRPLNHPITLSLEDRPFDHSAYNELSDYLKETIARSPEYQRAISGVTAKPAKTLSPPPPDDDLDDPIPF